jgi:hypothetical protein
MNNDKDLDWPTTDPSSHQRTLHMTTKLRKVQTRYQTHNLMRFVHEPRWGGSTPRRITCVTDSCRVIWTHYSKVKQVVVRDVWPGYLNRYRNKQVTGRQEPERTDVCFRNHVQICRKANSASYPAGTGNKAVCAWQQHQPASSTESMKFELAISPFAQFSNRDTLYLFTFISQHMFVVYLMTLSTSYCAFAAV